MGKVVSDSSGDYYYNAKGGQSKIRNGMVKDKDGNQYKVIGGGADARLELVKDENTETGFGATYKGKSKVDPKLREDIHNSMNDAKTLKNYLEMDDDDMDEEDWKRYEHLDKKRKTSEMRRAEGEYSRNRHKYQDMDDPTEGFGIGKILKLLGGEGSPHKLKKRSMSLIVMGKDKGGDLG